MAKGKMKKILAAVIGGIALAGAAFGAYQIVHNVQQQQQQNQAETLSSPVVMFDDSKNILSWNEVENATSYIVSINGEEMRVEGTSTKVDINETTTEMKVKAKSNGEYKDSDWSKSYTYTVSAEDTQKNLRIVISDFLGEDVKLKEIISVDIKNNNSMRPKVVVERNGKEFIDVLRFNYDTPFDSLNDALKNVDESTFLTMSSAETVEYDTMSEIINNAKYDRVVADYVAQGYTVSVVNSATQKYNESNQKASYDVHGLLKLTKGNETKFMDVSYRVRTEKSKGDNSYIDYIANSDKTTFYVNYSNELSGDAYEYAKKLDQEYSDQITISQAKKASQKTAYASDVIVEDEDDLSL